MYSVLSDVEARKITGGGSGGNNYYYKCWTTKEKNTGVMRPIRQAVWILVQARRYMVRRSSGRNN